MSKNVVIQEGGQGKQLTVDKLKTNLASGGTQLWVPEDTVEQTTKNITENGTYKASDDGYYGYSEVTVNVPGGAGGPPGGAGSSIVGKDGDGDDAIVTVDPETGELEEEKLPNHIHVVTPPYNPRGIYADGETIDVGPDSGFDVRALLADGSPYEAPGYPMGDIPLSELTVEPLTAEYDPSKEQGTGTSEYEGTEVNYNSRTTVTIKGSYEQGGQTVQIQEEYAVTSHSGPIYAFGTRYITDTSNGIGGYLCSPNPFTATMNGNIAIVSSFKYDDKTVYTAGRNAYQDSFNPEVDAPQNTVYPNSTELIDTVDFKAWVICYGEQQQHQAGAAQEINVSWPRPGDGAILSTTFDIRVGPSPSGDDDN
jgi:hypothetical protein